MSSYLLHRSNLYTTWLVSTQQASFCDHILLFKMPCIFNLLNTAHLLFTGYRVIKGIVVISTEVELQLFFLLSIIQFSAEKYWRNPQSGFMNYQGCYFFILKSATRFLWDACPHAHLWLFYSDNLLDRSRRQNLCNIVIIYTNTFAIILYLLFLYPSREQRFE